MKTVLQAREAGCSSALCSLNPLSIPGSRELAKVPSLTALKKARTPGSGTCVVEDLQSSLSPAGQPDTRGCFQVPLLPTSAGFPTGLKRTQEFSWHLFTHPDSRLRAQRWGSSTQGSGHLPKPRWLEEWGMEVGCPGSLPSSSPQSRPASRRRGR